MMKTDAKAKRLVAARLIYEANPAPQRGEKDTQFGLQDKKQQVFPAKSKHKDAGWFECELEVKGEDGHGSPDFGGPFVHGSPTMRFLYLSWKRTGPGDPVWVQRMKIPLESITWNLVQKAAKPGGLLEADVRGRRPTGSDAAHWKAARA